MTSTTYASPLLDRPGAAPLQDTEALIDATGVAWHYGDPLGEQRRAHTGTIVVDRSQRRVLQVTGPDAAEFLNNLLSQKLLDVPVGYAASALDLDMQGHILHHADVLRTEEGFFLDVPAVQFESLSTFLQKMVFWSQVEIVEADLAVLTLLGAPVETPATACVRTGWWTTLPRRDLLVPRDRLVETVTALETAGAHLAGLMAFTAERVRALEPELGVDLDAKSIPHEVPAWIGRGEHPGAVHLEKGCYRGQETVARVENLGRSPRVLVMLQLDGSAPEAPSPGADILGPAGGRSLGRLGTVVDDCDFGPIALAVVKRSALEQELQVGDVSVLVDPSSLPAERGEQAGRAAVERLRGRR
ncbi:folate-binding protein YgfZ [Corynebacterium sp.]|uniref:CAF17-like 4Fe-4S cluster assembly/insertion protein YgfZ n=1 Tax=Corynebacterium sp. TaxID=1720 RepID=UPI0026DEA67C|nr:folate-binding protein [Corynebacterium sp.]MDO5512366.1 folate-binding protein [Corynebacterium sp.]